MFTWRAGSPTRRAQNSTRRRARPIPSDLIRAHPSRSRPGRRHPRAPRQSQSRPIAPDQHLYGGVALGWRFANFEEHTKKRARNSRELARPQPWRPSICNLSPSPARQLTRALFARDLIGAPTWRRPDRRRGLPAACAQGERLASTRWASSARSPAVGCGDCGPTRVLLAQVGAG